MLYLNAYSVHHDLVNLVHILTTPKQCLKPLSQNSCLSVYIYSSTKLRLFLIIICPLVRYFLSPTLYPEPKLPMFLSGTAYIFTGSLLPSLYSCALKTPLINLEDVFLTGLCASRQLGLKLSDNKVNKRSRSPLQSAGKK